MSSTPQRNSSTCPLAEFLPSVVFELTLCLFHLIPILLRNATFFNKGNLETPQFALGGHPFFAGDFAAAATKIGLRAAKKGCTI